MINDEITIETTGIKYEFSKSDAPDIHTEHAPVVLPIVGWFSDVKAWAFPKFTVPLTEPSVHFHN